MRKVTLAIFGLLSTSVLAHAADLSKQEAGMILNYMGCTPSHVAAVANGVGPGGLFGGSSGGNIAMVITTCLRNGKPTAEEYAFLYDSDLGWFYYEKKTDTGQVRLWSKTGYKQIEPPTLPAPK